MAEEKIDVNYVAHLARLELSAGEVERFSRQLDDILGYVRQLEQLDVENIEPMAHATPVYDVMREDQARPGAGTESALGNAPERSSNQFRVTRVVEP
jgi:aspartyl-tRNA(Asn)/glutamyl-tRNA(Gln) amidotransferase subunit C